MIFIVLESACVPVSIDAAGLVLLTKETKQSQRNTLVCREMKTGIANCASEFSRIASGVRNKEEDIS